MEVSERKRPTLNVSKLSSTPPIDIEFQDLSYSVYGKDCKHILRSISGKFSSGELTAILGASGSGKTTLLNILAGYILYGVTGTIAVNGRPRQMKYFHKISTYIMQEDLLHPHITVDESMMVAARLKLEENISLQKKRIIVIEVLNLLGLENCLETRIENLSGGQKKRLSIALEMVSNPPVIFLDEPTSGLDTVSIKQCIDILRTLTGQKRTVICTVHQPSAAIFQQFDQVYFIAHGMCVYNGSTSNVIPHLSSVGLQCPITYSPAEYVIESVQTSEEFTSTLVAAIRNGKINRRTPTSNQTSSFENICLRRVYEGTTQTLETNADVKFPTSFWTQFCVLYGRMMLQMRRNKLMIWIQLFYHTLSGVLFGALFFSVGNDAEMQIANFKFYVSVMIFFVYSYLMSPVLLFPSEVKLIKREYFNRWYGLKPYFMALTLRNMPVLMILGLIFLLITYLLTNQPFEINRFVWFASVSILVGIASEGLGLAIGSVCSVTNGSAVAPTLGAICVLLSLYGVGYGTAIEPTMKTIMSLSYLRYGLVVISQAMLENRTPLDCFDEIFCYYRDPKHVLRDAGMSESSFDIQILALRIRMNSEFSYSVVNYATKSLRRGGQKSVCT